LIGALYSEPLISGRTLASELSLLADLSTLMVCRSNFVGPISVGM
jgi:hypothetical protein